MAKTQYFILRKADRNLLCTLKDGQDREEYKRVREAQGYIFQWVGKPPSIKTMEKWMEDGVAKSITGQRVEPDHPDSWLRVLGYI